MSLLGESDFLLGHKHSLSLIKSGSISLCLLLVEIRRYTVITGACM